MIEGLAKRIMNGYRMQRSENLDLLLTADLKDLCKAADRIREFYCGNKVNLCTIINGRSGRCSENCKFCAQSSHHKTGIEEYKFLDVNKIVEDCKRNEKEGVHRYSIVTAGKNLKGNDFQKALSAYKRMYAECSIELCASHGLLQEADFIALKETGVRRYHMNLETSKRYFASICTTHTYEDKLQCIHMALKAGLEVCSGGIIGMGEQWEDRIDLAFTLSELGIHSIPINALIPMKGTCFEDLPLISQEDILRTLAIFRLINPESDIRLAAGRANMENSGERAFQSGANATITGNMLTTSGNSIRQDIEMLIRLGFEI